MHWAGPITDPEQLRRRLTAALRAALKARDGVATAALRSAVSAVDNAEAVDLPPAQGATVPKTMLGVGAADVDRRELSAVDVIAVIRAEIADRTSAAAGYERLGRTEHAIRLRAEAAVLVTFLDDAIDHP